MTADDRDAEPGGGPAAGEVQGGRSRLQAAPADLPRAIAVGPLASALAVVFRSSIHLVDQARRAAGGSVPWGVRCFAQILALPEQEFDSSRSDEA